MNSALAASPVCDAVENFSRQSLSCADRQTEVFVKAQEEVTGLELRLKNSKRGMERQVQLTRLSLRVSDLTSGRYLKNKIVAKEIGKVEKQWGSAAQVEIQKVELPSKARFYTSNEYKIELKPSFSDSFSGNKRSLASSAESEAHFAGVMRAKEKKP
jgi:hypothetical protein